MKIPCGKLTAGTVLLLFSLLAPGLEITPDFQILNEKPRCRTDREASQVLAQHLEQIFGKPAAVREAGSVRPAAGCIILSGDPKLDSEEWSIRSDGKNLVISGGYPRGLYYGVCEFLEQFAGVRHFTKSAARIPQLKLITVPDGREFRRKPAFPYQRLIGCDIEKGAGQDYFLAFLKCYDDADPDIPGDLQPASLEKHHSFGHLTRNVPADRTDMLPVDAKGNRVRGLNGLGPGQICFSNPDFRKYAKEEVGRWIADAKKRAGKYGADEKSVIHYINLSQNDNHDFCCCKGCRKLAEKYGTLSGALIDFINDIASAYPDYVFETFAYMDTEEPPRGIRPRDNVMIQFAMLGRDNVWYDLLRPLSHPANAVPLKIYQSWRNIAKLKATWCYHRLYSITESFVWPQCMYWYIQEDMRFYRGFGSQGILAESELCDTDGGIFSPRAFHELHVYLAAKLMDNPDCDAGKLIGEFFDYQYGPATSEMKGYADYLRKRLDSIRGKMCAIPTSARSCFDADFFRTIEGFLNRAEKKAAGNKRILENIALERVPVDFAAANLWEPYGSKVYPSRKFLCDRLVKNIELSFRHYFTERAGRLLDYYADKKKKTLACVDALRNPVPVPPGMEKLNILQFTAAQQSPTLAVDDPDAVLGKTIRFSKELSGFEQAKHPMEFGIYDHILKEVVLRKVLKPEEIAQDGKYHLYRIGKFIPDGRHRLTMWGQASWGLHLSDLVRQVWSAVDSDRMYEVYLSCKMTGPAYVKGSKEKNAVSVDKAVFVKLDAPALPDGFKPETAVQVFAARAAAGKTADDPEAAFQSALRLLKVPDPQYPHDKNPMEFGIYDKTAKKVLFKKVFTPEEIPSDEKYHLYKVGKFSVVKNHEFRMWGQASWGLDLDDLLTPVLKSAAEGDTFTVFVSCRLTGPAYAKGSNNQNGVYVDRVLFVREAQH